jgi:IS605 OrfB family transposase
VPVVRSLSFPLSVTHTLSNIHCPRFSDTPLAPSVRNLLDDFRLLVNQCLRQALLTRKTSRGSLSRFARDRALAARVNGQIGLLAADVALALAKGHRRRLRSGLRSRPPYVQAPFLRVPARGFHFDAESGKLRISVRRCEWTSLTVSVSNYHRSVLATPGFRIKQLHLGLHRLVLLYEKDAPEPYTPTSLVALDTNESSLDGVRVDNAGAQLVRVSFPELRTIQACHFSRRRFLGRKKAHDRRVARRLLRREGWRERHRIRSRLHDLTRRFVEGAARDRAALALEDLSRLPSPRFRSRSTNRRLSSWPRAELHRQLAYKAAERGVPIYWVNPYRSSRTCPRCGAVTVHRSRAGPRFDCRQCGWSMDRQLNAGVNLGATVLREHAELGGLRLAPDALLDEVVRPLYPRVQRLGARAERTGREGGRSNARLRR